MNGVGRAKFSINTLGVAAYSFRFMFSPSLSKRTNKKKKKKERKKEKLKSSEVPVSK